MSERQIKAIQNFMMVVFLAWMIFCVFSVFRVNAESRIEYKIQAIKEFKSNCVAKKGSVHHEETLFSINVYCNKKDGNETIFYSEYKDDDFINSFANKATFGLIGLNNE